MKIKTTIVRPGTILCWKEYNIFTKLWNKLKKRDLPYNKFEIIPTSIELLTIDRYNLQHILLYVSIINRKYINYNLSMIIVQKIEIGTMLKL